MNIQKINKTQYKERVNNTDNNQENDLKLFNYTMTKIPTEFEKKNNKKKYNKKFEF